MLLLDRSGVKANEWTLTESVEIDNMGPALVPWDRLPYVLSAKALDQRIGGQIPNSLPVTALSPYLSRLALIAILFPTFADGRGYSLAKAIRRAGFEGILRATGPLIPDQFDYALACGFDEIEMPDSTASRQTVLQWRQALGRLSQTYQRGYRREGNILDRRRQARVDNLGQ